MDQKLKPVISPERSANTSDGPITRLSAGELAEQIRTGKLTSRAAVEAHIKRIQEVNPHLNALVVELFDKARADAKAADEAQARGEHLGPLHGVPITMKEEFAVQGTPSTFGVESRATLKADADGLPAQLLRKSGAIILGKTNVAQLLIYHESDNPVYGKTNNPWNLERSPGGSSGGEAALIAAGASPLGLGSDLGGSVRVPAAFCGIYGLKPTANRFPSTDQPGHLFEPMHDIVSQPGPLARNVADLALVMSILSSQEDGTNPARSGKNGAQPSHTSEQAEWLSYPTAAVKGLRVGMYTYDGFFEAAPSVQRAVGVAAKALERRGVQVVEWQPPDVPQAMRLFFGLLSADGGKWFKKFLGVGKRDRRTSGLLQLGGLPGVIRRAMGFALKVVGQRKTAELLSTLGARNPEQYQKLVQAQADYREKFLAAMDKAGIDAILCPPYALPALTHGSSYNLATAASYAELYNVLGMPAGVAPVSKVQPGEESQRPASRDMVLSAARSVEIGSTGLPLGVQVVARHWREDIVLSLLGALESELRSESDYPTHPPM
jgi:fatty acid amide hydrolase